MNYIDGKEFLALKEEEIYKMVPPVGLAKKIIRMLPSTSSVSLQLVWSIVRLNWLFQLMKMCPHGSYFVLVIGDTNRFILGGVLTVKKN